MFNIQTFYAFWNRKIASFLLCWHCSTMKESEERESLGTTHVCATTFMTENKIFSQEKITDDYEKVIKQLKRALT